jgi:predicted alpha/beta superfamily hydrolase
MKRLVFIFYLFLSQNLSGQDTILRKQSKPFVLGKINEIESKILLEKRIVNIYLPDGYNEKDNIQYPVIYLLDGSADEDFIHIAGLLQFLNFPWVNKVPKTILVGIANVDRKRDFTFPTTIEKDKKDFPTTGRSEKFISFIELELQPYIDRNYKTTRNKTIIGQSLGGLLAIEVLFKKPTLFTNYIIVSPSLWWNNQSLLKTYPYVFKSNVTSPISIYIAVGKEEKLMEEDVKKLVSILKKDPRKNIKVNFEYFTDEDHASILHNAVYKGLKKINENLIKNN